MGLLDRVEIKTPEQVSAMRAAGLLTGQTLELLRSSVRPGITTAALDRLAEEHIRDNGGTPSFLGYGRPPFPGTICVSVNDEVVHGVPGPRALDEGDLVSIDCGAILDGWHGDAAITVPVAEVPEELHHLVRVAERALAAGIAAAVPGNRVSDISAAVETTVREAGDYGILRNFTGHGIGTAMHQAPDVPNYGRSVHTRLRPGMALAIEPMLTLGSADWELDDDEWTVRTDDGSWAAHVEHTLAITENGPWVLTAVDS